MTPTLIMTRPSHIATATVEEYRATISQPFEVIMSPLIKIVPCDVRGIDCNPDHLIFTSANAVAQIDRIGLSRAGVAWCVGQRTAVAAGAAGFVTRSVNGTGADLLALIRSENPTGTFLHLHGRHTYVSFAQELGERCRGLCVYDQIAVPPSNAARTALVGTAPVIIPLYSPRSARIMTSSVQITAPTWMVAISAQTADHSPPANDRVRWRVAATPDQKGMLDATRLVFDALDKDSSP